MLRGFDISAYQSNIAPTADFVFVKATEGASYTSSKFAVQWQSAKARAKHRGAYHFARPEESSAASQAARFLAIVQPARGESVWLDLEESKLSQSDTNAWAKAWGDYVRQHAPGVTSGVYMGRGYASSGTGRGLAQHFDLWWYPQYPSSTRTSTWHTAFNPWLPPGLTCGWHMPHIWQWTDNLDGLDANLTPLTIGQLAGQGGTTPPPPSPHEEIEMIARDIKPGMDAKTEFPIKPGAFTTLVAGTDNSYDNGVVKATKPVKLRVRILHTDGHWQPWEPVVGRAAADSVTKVQTVAIADPAHAVLVTVTRMDGDGTEPLTIGAY